MGKSPRNTWESPLSRGRCVCRGSRTRSGRASVTNQRRLGWHFCRRAWSTVCDTEPSSMRAGGFEPVVGGRPTVDPWAESSTSSVTASSSELQGFLSSFSRRIWPPFLSRERSQSAPVTVEAAKTTATTFTATRSAGSGPGEAVYVSYAPLHAGTAPPSMARPAATTVPVTSAYLLHQPLFRYHLYAGLVPADHLGLVTATAVDDVLRDPAPFCCQSV